jgi:hypothetical protein
MLIQVNLLFGERGKIFLFLSSDLLIIFEKFGAIINGIKY